MNMGLKEDEYSTGEIKLGEWNSNFNECWNKANSEFIPIVLYWTPGTGCGNCNVFENRVLRNDEFKKFMSGKGSNYIWCYCEGQGHPGKPIIRGHETASGARSPVMSRYPYILLYWRYGMMNSNSNSTTSYNGATIECRFSGLDTSIPHG